MAFEKLVSISILLQGTPNQENYAFSCLALSLLALIGSTVGTLTEKRNLTIASIVLALFVLCLDVAYVFIY